MLLTITCTTPQATDIGFLLHKNPARPQSFDLAFGKAHVFYPETRNEKCTAALLLEVDPVGLVRGRGGERTLDQYVNDRPYVASSLLSVAIAQVFGTALGGRCKERPELVEQKLQLEARLPALPCRDGAGFLRSLFEPLGYDVSVEPHLLDEANPSWGESRYFTVTLKGTQRLVDLLSHLYVLVPVLDDNKHYWVGDDEVAKLVRHGEGWLAQHPLREAIAKRYLKHQRGLARNALDQLVAAEMPDPDGADAAHAEEEATLERRISLNEQRIAAVLEALRQSKASRVLDLGCGEGQLLRALLTERMFDEIVGVDVSHRALEIATRRLDLETMPERQRARIKLLQGALTYRDERLAGYDAAAVVEVIEHLDLSRLRSFERVLFEFARPKTIVLTTPNAEFNVKFEKLPAGTMRHHDHRFEWNRAEFAAWANGVAEHFGYRVRFSFIGAEDATVGAPTQMAVFTS
jgi:3' terminal RNA ribose 2'-O-methyltransferase Hen1